METARLVADRAKQAYGARLASVWVYGSRVRGDHHNESDLDILLVMTGEDHGLISQLRDPLWDRLSESLRPQLGDDRWFFLSLMPSYVERIDKWDTMFYRSFRRHAIRVL